MTRYLLAFSVLWALPGPIQAQPRPSPVPGDPAPSDSPDPEPLVLEELAITAPVEAEAPLPRPSAGLDEEALDALDEDDPNRILLRVPGVYVRQEDGYGLRPNIGLRGASAERSQNITLMEDGVLLAPAPYAAPAAYFFPLMTRMVGVDIIRGPDMVRFGPHSVGGAIDLRTRDVPEGAAGELDYALGTELYQKLHMYYGASNDWGGLLFEGVRLDTEGFKDLDWGSDDTGFSRTELMLRGRVQSDPERRVLHRLELKLGYSREESNETYLGLTDEDFRRTPLRRYGASALDRMEWDRTSVHVRYTVSNDGPLELETTAYRNDFTRAWRKLERFGNGPSIGEVLADPRDATNAPYYGVLTGERDSNSADDSLIVGTTARSYISQGVQSVLRLRFQSGGTDHQVEAGLRLHGDEIDRRHTTEQFAVTGRQLIGDGRNPDETSRRRDRATAIAAHVAYGITVEGLTLTPGIRTEIVRTARLNRQTGSESGQVQHAVLPGVGARYAFTDAFALRAGVYRGFSPVAPGQRAEIEPETSVNFELGIRLEDGDEGSHAELVGFFNNYENLTGRCSLSAGCAEAMVDQQFNAGAVQVAGAELSLAHEFDFGSGVRVPAELSYTFAWSRFQTDFTSSNPQYGDVRRGDELPYLPAHQAALHVGLRAGRFSMDASGVFVAPMREQAGQGSGGARTDTQAMVDLVARYDVMDDAALYVRALNVLFAEPIVSRRPFGARPARPFALQLGIRHAL